MFYVASAFLEGEGLAFGKHSAVISAFGREFAKTGKVPKQFHRYLITAEEARKEADYGLQVNISAENAQETINQAQEMLEFAENSL
jgi:uncharacterized protein (UPF0332 family)